MEDNTMKVKNAIKRLEKMNPEADLKLHHFLGDDVTFICSAVGKEGIVWIEGKGDNDNREELNARYFNKKQNNISDEEFYKDLLEIYTLDDIKEYLPEEYENAVKSCKELNLI